MFVILLKWILRFVKFENQFINISKEKKIELNCLVLWKNMSTIISQHFFTLTVKSLEYSMTPVWRINPLFFEGLKKLYKAFKNCIKEKTINHQTSFLQWNKLCIRRKWKYWCQWRLRIFLRVKLMFRKTWGQWKTKLRYL